MGICDIMIVTISQLTSGEARKGQSENQISFDFLGVVKEPRLVNAHFAALTTTKRPGLFF